MLLLERKHNQRIRLEIEGMDPIYIHAWPKGKSVTIAIQAPQSVKIRRDELERRDSDDNV